MELHYNAFISYKHAPLDTKVAAEVQRQLERFQIPGAIRKATGISRINRIFRDKEELTLTSDLNETIENALNHSDFLIVICSKATKESIWVQREIEFFLKTHDRKHILTVVAEGEPVDVVPQILQFQEMELQTEDGNIETVQVPIEPLSCDYRGNFPKARREELPRLAAALLGCSYDDLRRRQRQYRMRRIVAAATALGVALTALAVYYAWSAAQIQENYEQSLRNQSDYLASESQKLLASGDRLTAMLLALEALPSEDSDRPVTAKAVNALSEASYAYVAYGNSGLSLDKAYTCQGAVVGFCVNEEETLLAAVHSNYYNLTVWDTQTGEELFGKTYEEQVRSLDFAPDGSLLAVVDQKLFCYDPTTGNCRWEYEFDWVADEMAICPNGTIAVTTVHHITVLNGDGTLMTVLDAPKDTEGELFQLSEVAISSDGSFVAAALALNEKEYAGCLVVWDVKSGEAKMNTTSLYWVRNLQFLDNGTVLAASLTGDENSLTYTDSSGNVSHMLYPGSLALLCMDTQSNTLWERQVEFPQQYYGTHVEQMDFLTEDERTVSAVACSVGNVCEVVDVSSGEVLERVDFPDPIVDLQTGKNGFVCIQTSGTWALYLYSSRFPVVHEGFVGNLIDGLYGDNTFVYQNGSTQILRYTKGIYDENWISLSGEDSAFNNMMDRRLTDDGVLVQTNDGTIQYYDAVQQKLLWTWTVPEDTSPYSYSLVDIEDSGDTALVIYDSYEAQYLLRFNLATGEPVRIDLEADLQKDAVRYCDGAVYYQTSWIVTDDQTGESWIKKGIARVDLQSGETEKISLAMNFEATGFQVDAKGETFLLYAQYGSEVGIYADGELNEVTGVYAPAATAMSDDASLFALVGDHDVYVTDAKINVLYTIPTNGMHPQSMQFYAGQLLVAYDNGTLYRYDAQTGDYIGNLEITAGSFSSTPYFVWDFSQEGILALHLNQELNLIDLESWQLYTQVGRCVAYLPQENAVLVMGTTEDSSTVIGMYELYTTQGLIEKARALLAGLELTPEQKTEYGIGD